jgi:hypothetical protein
MTIALCPPKSKGIVELMEFRETSHRYFYKGQELMGVTTAFKKTGIVDFSKVRDVVMEPAAAVGDAVHEMARLYGLGELDESTIDDGSETGFDLWGYYDAIKKFYAERVKEVLLLEQMVCDPYFLFAGTPDIVYLNNENRVCVDDWKTPVKPHPAWNYQTAPYKRAVERCFDIKIHDRGGVLLKPDGDYKRHPHKGNADLKKFLAILTTAQIKEEHRIRT